MHRINTLVIMLLVICAGLVQVTAFSYMEILGVKPDILLVLVVFISLSCYKPEMLKASILAGLAKDITSSSVLGSYALSFLLVGLFLNYHQNKFYREKASTQVILGFCSYLFVSMLVFWLNALAHRELSISYLFFNILIKGAFYTAIISPAVFFIASKILRIRLAQVL